MRGGGGAVSQDNDYDRIRSMCEKFLEDHDQDVDTLLSWLGDDL